MVHLPGFARPRVSRAFTYPKGVRGALLAGIRHTWPCVAIAVAGCATVGFNLPSGTSTKFNILTGSKGDDTKNHPANVAFAVSASCAQGQQLVGGGYDLINNSNASPTLLVVEGSYPSAANTWTVQVRNPDNPAYYSGDADVVVVAVAYCVDTPNYDLSTEIVTQQTTIPQTPNTTTDIDVRCSQTSSLALSGGFLTTSLPTYSEPGGAVHQAFWPGLEGTGITGSGPAFPDNTHSAMGWHLTQQYTPASVYTAPQPPVTTTVYAICARKNINVQSYRLATVSAVLDPTADVKPMCQTGEFTVGGGYSGVPWSVSTVISEVSGSRAQASSFAWNSWVVSGTSSGSSMSASALCVRIPII